jgi:serine/threonine protein kinase
MDGGAAIASGGFGCVFRPSIKCKNKKTKKNTVSKLMVKELADRELLESKKIFDEINKIPNSGDFFIIPADICKPGNLTSEDKLNFDTKCDSLLKKKINSKNVNKSLNKLRMIQLLDGGEDLSNFFENNIITANKFIIINNQLVKLLTQGIVKMNDKYIFHFDIKSANILINENTIKLVDWGLSNRINATFVRDKYIPKPLKFRPLHFNMPFSIVLLNDETNIYINNFIKQKHTLNELVDFLFNLYETKISTNIIGKHHDDLIKFILKSHLYPKTNPDLIIFTYMAEIVHHFTENGRFMAEKYFYDVYLKNCDIWGFATVYLLLAIDNIENLSIEYNDKMKFKEEIFKIFRKYIIDCSFKPIPVNKYANELLNLNKLIKKSEIGTSKKVYSTTDSFNKNTFQNLKFFDKFNIKKKITNTSKAYKYIKQKSNTQTRKLSTQTRKLNIHTRKSQVKKPVPRKARAKKYKMKKTNK